MNFFPRNPFSIYQHLTHTHSIYYILIVKIIENITMTTRKKSEKDEKSQNLLDVVFIEKKNYKNIHYIFILCVAFGMMKKYHF